MTITVLDLFCGIGGFSYGLQQAGCTIVGGIDLNARAIAIYQDQFGPRGVIADLRNHIDFAYLLDRMPIDATKIDLLVGAPPIGGWIMRHDSSPDIELLDVFATAVQYIKPRFFLLEWRVPRAPQEQIVLDHWKHRLSSLGLNVYSEEINARDYGVPQQRVRVYLYGGARNTASWQRLLPRLSEHRPSTTIAQALGDLPPVGTSHDSLHTLPVVPPRIYNFLQGSAYQSDYPRRQMPRLRQLTWDTPAPTITGWLNPLYVHPDEHRLLTLRERARLQTFPDSFRLTNNGRVTAELLSQATPPLLAQQIGTALFEWLHDVESNTENAISQHSLTSTPQQSVPEPDNSIHTIPDEPEPEPEHQTDVPIEWIEQSYPMIVKWIAKQGLILSEDVLRQYHLGLKQRGFVILAGDSGTGKTWLTKAYADAIGADYELVAVAPNWTTNEDLLGYHNPLTEQYHDTIFSQFLRKAAAAAQRANDLHSAPQPFHVVFDEMNIARIEYYMAQLLSLLEVRARGEDAVIRLGQESVIFPSNLILIGTINMDVTTHELSPKVLDRAQLVHMPISRKAIIAHLGKVPYASLLIAIWDALRHIAPFGFRILTEIDGYVRDADTLDISWQQALDDQILMKILPRISGSDVVKP